MSNTLDTNESNNASKRSAARAKGLRLAARVATVGGLAVAALGLREARAATASTPAAMTASANANADANANANASANDDAKPLPFENLVSVKGGCGCAPCWGPPAPPPSRNA